MADRSLDSTAYTVDRLAEGWGVHPQTIRKLLKAGDLACVRLGRRILIPAAAAARYLAEHAEVVER